MTIYSEMVDTIKKGDMKRLRQILRHKGVYNARNFLQRELDLPLAVAIESSGRNGVSEALKMLIASGFDVNEEIHHEASFHAGWRPIWTAMLNGNVDVVSFLIEKGLELNWPVSQAGNTPPPLSAACWLIRRNPNYMEMIRLLIGAGVQLNPQDSPPPLHCLMAAGRDSKGQSPVNAARLLLSSGALPNFLGCLLTTNGNHGVFGTPLHAYSNSGIETVEALIEFGANPNIVASNGENALQFFNRYQQLVQKSSTVNPEVTEVDKIVGLLSSSKAPDGNNPLPSTASFMSKDRKSGDYSERDRSTARTDFLTPSK